jgi:hypothetical protein
LAEALLALGCRARRQMTRHRHSRRERAASAESTGRDTWEASQKHSTAAAQSQSLRACLCVLGGCCCGGAARLLARATLAAPADRRADTQRMRATPRAQRALASAHSLCYTALTTVLGCAPLEKLHACGRRGGGCTMASRVADAPSRRCRVKARAPL